MISGETLVSSLKIIIVSSIFFVWFIRYSNIVEEFKFYKLPNWLRDLVGILKISFSLMLLNNNVNVVMIGSFGIAVLMLAALGTHIRIGNPFSKMLPSLTLMVFSVFIFSFHLGL
jgi:hypothetical protein